MLLPTDTVRAPDLVRLVAKPLSEELKGTRFIKLEHQTFVGALSRGRINQIHTYILTGY